MSNIFHIYVDGSWKRNKPEISGWAFVILNNKKEIVLQKSGVVYCLSRQVDGELYATIQAVKYATKLENFDKIYIYYDYAGIEAWVKGSWKAKSEVAIEYVSRMKKYEKILEKSIFVKIKSHAGEDSWNDYVDLYAKKEVDSFEKDKYDHL